MHGIVATSLLVISLVGAGGVVASLARGTTFPLVLTLWFTAATACGMVAGRVVSHRLSARHVQAGFALVVLAVGVGLLLKAISSP
jgi:uncharacterized membrane protein YfcA